MEQKMAKGSGLTPRQEQLLELIIQEPYFTDNFYLNGGTALSSWYLHHRESYDLDFFSVHPFDYDRISRWFRQSQTKIEYRSIQMDEDYGFLTVHLRFPDNGFLKVDFNHYSNFQIKKGFKWRGLEIDSLEDIAVNKLHLLASLPRTRDYIDFFFILQKHKFSLDKLKANAAKKFQEEIDPLKLIKNFLKVSEYSDLPKMLVPFNQKAMEKFYLDLAKSLKTQIFKK